MYKWFNKSTAVFIWRLMLLPACWLLPAEAQPPEEYAVKAAFVYNFLKYIEWPDTADCKASRTLKLGIWGMNRFGASFDKFKEKPIGNCFVEISGISDHQALDRFQAVFISHSEKAALPTILAGLKSFPVLTLSDSPGFMQAGVMINLIQREDKIGFEINLQAAKSAGLNISSQLLKLASAIQE